MIHFKNPIAQMDFRVLPKALLKICEDFEALSLCFYVTPVVTRVREGLCGDQAGTDSGVHEAGRAVDFRDQYVNERGEWKRLYTGEQVETIVNSLNLKYPRADGKPTCLHHKFGAGPMHFHVQLEAKALEKGEPLSRAEIPKED